MRDSTRFWRSGLWIALVSILAGCHFEVTNLGTLPGGSESWANAVNEDGVIVGASENSAGHKRATRWNPDGTLDDLGTLGGDWSEAHGINNLGVVVGESQTASGEIHAFFTWGAAMHDLGPGAAYAVNDNIWITGRGPWEDAEHAQGVVWKWAGAPTDLVAADPTVEEAWGWGINDSNEIAGTRDDCDGPQGVFKWTDAGISNPPLGGAAIPEGCYTWGRDINGFGAIAGFAIFGDSLPGKRQAAVFRSTGVTRLTAYDDSRGLGNNNLGWVVGSRKVVQAGPDRLEPFVWYSGMGAQQILPMLAGDEGLANAVNQYGVIVGWSTLANGNRRAVRWDPGAEEPDPIDDYGPTSPDTREPKDLTGGTGVPPLPPPTRDTTLVQKDTRDSGKR